MASMLNPSNNPPEQQYNLVFLQQLIRSHPLACLGGLWVSLVLLGSVATVGLFNPGTINQEGSSPTPTLETIQESTPQSTARKGLPLVVFGTVALACAGGSLLVTQVLKHAAEHHNSAKGSKPIVTVRKKPRPSSKKRRPLPQTPQPVAAQNQRDSGQALQPNLTRQQPIQGTGNHSPRGVAPLMRTGDGGNRRPNPLGMDNQEWVSSSQFPIANSQFPEARIPTPTRRQPLRGTGNASSRRVEPLRQTGGEFRARPTSQDLNNRVATAAEKGAYVTVLPPEESHPLDGRQESLADLLDLRKQHSLTSLMRGKSLL